MVRFCLFFQAVSGFPADISFFLLFIEHTAGGLAAYWCFGFTCRFTAVLTRLKLVVKEI